MPGDIILAIDDQALDSVNKLLSLLDEHQVGEVVKALRNGATQDILVTLQLGN